MPIDIHDPVLRKWWESDMGFGQEIALPPPPATIVIWFRRRWIPVFVAKLFNRLPTCWLTIWLQPLIYSRSMEFRGCYLKSVKTERSGT